MPAGNSWATPTSRGRSTRSSDQRGDDLTSMDTMEKFTGKRPVGWLGPGLTQTFETPDLLADSRRQIYRRLGLRRRADRDPHRQGPLVTLPYTVEFNDIPMMIVQHHEGDYLDQSVHRQFRAALRGGRGAAKSWRSPSTRTFPASRSASSSWKRSTTTSTNSTACCTGTASRFSTGT